MACDFSLQGHTSVLVKTLYFPDFVEHTSRLRRARVACLFEWQRCECVVCVCVKFDDNPVVHALVKKEEMH